MIIVHTTLLSNLDSIREDGILTTYARGKRAAVWLHADACNTWAETHVRSRHDADGQDLVHIYCDVPEETLVRHARGVWWTSEDISPDQFVRVMVARTVYEDIAL